MATSHARAGMWACTSDITTSGWACGAKEKADVTVEARIEVRWSCRRKEREYRRAIKFFMPYCCQILIIKRSQSAAVKYSEYC